MAYVDTETGELYDSCPRCAELEVQVRAMEKERRADRAARSKAERALEKDVVAKRDKSDWERILTYWLAAFPDKKPTAKGIKSARATKFFMRCDSGATVEDVELAIDGAKEWPYIVFGKRQKSGSKSDLADDLEDIVSLGKDANFDFLVLAGRVARGIAHTGARNGTD